MSILISQQIYVTSFIYHSIYNLHPYNSILVYINEYNIYMTILYTCITIKISESQFIKDEKHCKGLGNYYN